MKANITMPLFFLCTKDVYSPKSRIYTYMYREHSHRYKPLNSIYSRLNVDFLRVYTFPTIN